MSKLIFKPFEWDSTDGPAIDLLNQLGCNAYVTYRKLEDGRLTYEAAFSDTYKRGFDSQEDAKAWVEKEFKEAIEWHVEGASKSDVKHKCTEWQPIETAPKDGTAILLRQGPFVGSGRYMHLDYYNYAGSGKKYFFFDGESLPSGATHWMPLPEPPKEEKK